MTHTTFLEVDTEDQAVVQNQYPDATISKDVLDGPALIDACKDAEVVSCFIHTHFTKDILNALPALKLLNTRSVGYDHIDIETCKERGITVCNVPDYGSHVIAEHVFALLLSTLRHIPEGDRRVNDGAFDYH